MKRTVLLLVAFLYAAARADAQQASATANSGMFSFPQGISVIASGEAHTGDVIERIPIGVFGKAGADATALQKSARLLSDLKSLVGRVSPASRITNETVATMLDGREAIAGAEILAPPPEVSRLMAALKAANWQETGLTTPRAS